MALRKRNANCFYCQVCWKTAREDHKGVAFKRVKALSHSDTTFGVYLDSGFVWAGSACCAWDAKVKALDELGVEKFKKV